MKEEFLATLSHELRTPMNVILGWLEVLSSGKPVRDLTSTLNLILRNAHLQAKLIDDLLDINRLVSGNLRLEMASVDVGAILNATTEALRPIADARNIQLTADVESAPVILLADGRRVQQIL